MRARLLRPLLRELRSQGWNIDVKSLRRGWLASFLLNTVKAKGDLPSMWPAGLRELEKAFEGGGRAQSCLFQGFTGGDGGGGPGPSPRLPGPLPGTAPPGFRLRDSGTCPRSLLLPPTSQEPLLCLMKLRAGLGCHALGSQQFPYCQVPRDRCPVLTPVNAVITPGLPWAEAAPSQGLLRSIAQTWRMAEAGILGHHRIHLHLMPELPPP